ncbi:hypothetical protein [Saccharothrix texasensis]|uniref:Uncharacterized protein n=1 Tax=Saccharothrix texasensis TaxID=103734 RepID=A0A3N1HHC7_9PSEU|nr:hypothetical protein [Saccharothrix texasensis]ROP41923.1 hypothetical protein EDD40_7409 [Saccharothrix texasensis]
MAAGALVALLGLVAAIFGPVPDRLKDETEVSNFHAKPVNKRGVTQFVLPLDAPLADLPSEPSGYCSEPIIDWLSKIGKEIPPYQRISITNTAEEGAMLAISNVRAVDVRRYEPQPVMVFTCPDGGTGDNAVLHLRLDHDPQAQLFNVDTGKTGPFAFNLQPGEQGSIELHLLGDEGNSYSGRIVADVSTGGKTTTVDLPLNGGVDGFDRISAGKYAQLYVRPGMKPGTLTCGWNDAKSEERGTMSPSSDCRPEQIRSILAEIK